MGRSKVGLSTETSLVNALRRDLLAAEWTVDVVDGLLSPMAQAAMGRDQLVPAILEMRTQTSPAAVLTRLFVLAQPVKPGELEYALPTLGVEGGVDLGLMVTGSENGVDVCRAVVDLRPHTALIPIHDEDGEASPVRRFEWWVASDLSQAQTGLPPSEDYVLGIASASTNLLRITLRDRVASALDLGCGCGILALYLSTHCDRVVATDISARACSFTRFNAALNQADIEVLEGSLFEPVAGQRFRLITSNPPFVITPQAVRARCNLEYRDGGMERDNLIRKIVREAPSHLVEGGTLQMLANWEVGQKERWWMRRPTAWIEEAANPLIEAGMDVRAWVVQRDLVDVAQYAEWWMRDQWGENVNADVWAAEYEEWLREFARSGTWHVGLGSINLRVERARRGTAELSIVTEYLPDGEPVDGRAVATALDNLVVPENWKDLTLQRQSDVREARYFVPGQADPELVRITQGRNGGRDRTVTSAVAALIGVSDGELTPGQVIPAIAMLLDKAESEVVSELEEALPELLRSGVLKKP